MTRPHPMGDTRTHLILLRTMAAQTGADTVRAFDDGMLDPTSWSAAVTRCRDCHWVDGCRRVLAEPVETPRPVPSDCANSELLRDIIVPR